MRSGLSTAGDRRVSTLAKCDGENGGIGSSEGSEVAIALPQRQQRRQRRPTRAQCSDTREHIALDEGIPVDASHLWAHEDVSICYEYLDHTADVQIHSWGSTLEESFEQQVLGIMGLITELPTVQASSVREVSATGHDLPSLLYNFLDEWLFQFNAEHFVCRRIKITSMEKKTFTISSIGAGETFVLGQHPQGTEVKAITYSAMRITEAESRSDVLVIVDI